MNYIFPLTFFSPKTQVLQKFSPLCSLNEQGRNLTDIVEGICLTPSETHRLEQSISSSNPNISQFSDKNFINRNQVRELESDLKTKLLDSYNPVGVEQKPYGKIFKDLRVESEFLQEKFEASTDLPILVEHMFETDMLPCLTFSFTRNQCERYVEILLDYFEKKEAYLRATKYAEKINYLKTKRDREVAVSKKTRDREPTTSNSDVNEKETSNVNETDYSLLDEHLPECVLGERRAYSRQEIEEQLDRAFGTDRSDWRRRAIMRGFSFHHAGLNAKKRVCVESLFRNKFLKLVFCTSTLAQGIHVPCKSVIFIEDSIFLNSGLFKQCSGRAGRRGR